MNLTKEQQYFINTTLPYRLDAIDMLNLIVQMKTEDSQPHTVEIDGKPCGAGFWISFTNAVIENGIVHCRVMLEFLGLKVNKDKILISRGTNQRRSSDLFIEDFSKKDVPLQPISVEGTVKCYSGSMDEAKQALAHTIWLANKGLAHSTSSTFCEPNDWKYLEITSRAIPSLMISKFYTPLGMHPPESNIFHRSREGSNYQLEKNHASKT